MLDYSGLLGAKTTSIIYVQKMTRKTNELKWNAGRQTDFQLKLCIAT